MSEGHIQNGSRRINLIHDCHPAIRQDEINVMVSRFQDDMR